MEFTISKAHEWIASHEDGSEVTIPSIFLFESDPVCFQLMAHAAQNKRMKVTFEQEELVFDARNGAYLTPEIMAWKNYLQLNKQHFLDYCRYLQKNKMVKRCQDSIQIGG